MKILVIHNKYGEFSGEEAAVEAQIHLFRENGHKVVTFFRSSEELEEMPLGKFRAFLCAFYNLNAIKKVSTLIINEQIEIVHVHNLYPLISPAILPVIKRMGIPIVMTVHNYRLLCPNGLFFTEGSICEKCIDKRKEFNCITNNCEGSFFKSTGYALRNFWARKRKYYLANVDAFLNLSSLQNKKLIENGFSASKCFIIPNMYGNWINENDYKEGNYIAYVGRISTEKGTDIILKLAEKLPKLNFKIAGSLNSSIELSKKNDNVEYVGFLTNEKLSKFYSNSLFTLFTSICNETFGLSIIEAFAHKKPVVASDLGASPEIIDNNESGIIYKNNNLNDLAEKVKELYYDKKKVKEMGGNAYLKLKANYTPKRYYQNLLKVYSYLLKK